MWAENLPFGGNLGESWNFEHRYNLVCRKCSYVCRKKASFCPPSLCQPTRPLLTTAGRVCWLQWTVITLEAVVGVKATVLSSSSILVTWQDAAASRNDDNNNNNTATTTTTRAIIVAYSVHFYPKSPRRREVQRVVTATNETLTNLRPDTEYVIYVTAYAYQGKSAPSQHVTARTLPQGNHALLPLLPGYYLPRQLSLSINQSIRRHLYSAVCRERIRGTA